VIATSLIAGKLLYHRHIMRAIGNPDGGEHGRRYLSLLAVFAESGALYTITAIVYIPLYAINSDFVFVWAAVLEAAAVSSGLFCSYLAVLTMLIPGYWPHANRASHGARYCCFELKAR